MAKLTNELLEQFTPQHKMGFKLLKDVQLKNMFPTYENLFKKIEIHLKCLAELPDDLSNIHYQYNLMYDNVFSIMGKRGSGKTSAIFTLKRKIEKEYENHVVLPVIMPELIPEGSDIIGWILSTLESVISDIERKIEGCHSYQENEDHDFFKNCMFQSNNKLRREYNRVKELCFSRGYKAEMMESFNTMVGNTERQTQNSFDFSKELSRFWTTLTEAIKKAYNSETAKRNGPPLIYILFDDVDLTPSKVVELFSTIIKYLSHPNLIIITTADEELFYEVIENDLNRKICGDSGRIYDRHFFEKLITTQSLLYFSDMDIKMVLDSLTDSKIQETAKLYVGKILPPSCRYYLETYDTSAKKRGFIERVDSESKRIINLECVLRQSLFKYVKCLNPELCNEYDTFLYYHGKKDNFIMPYLLFFGETSRQIANECFIVQEFFESLEKIHVVFRRLDLEEGKLLKHREMYQQIYHFLYSTVNSHGKILLENEQAHDLVNKIWCFEKEQWKLFLDYNYLSTRCIEAVNEFPDNEIDIIKSTIALFILLFFVENVLLLSDKLPDNGSITPNRNKVHGENDLVTTIDRLTTYGYSLVKRSWDTEAGITQFLYVNDWILENIQRVKKFDLCNYTEVKELLYSYKNKDIWTEGAKINYELLMRWAKQSPAWFSTMTQILYLAYEDIYLVRRDICKRFNLLEIMELRDEYLEETTLKLREKLQTFLTDRIQKAGGVITFERISALYQAIQEEDYQKQLKAIFKESAENANSLKELKGIIDERLEQEVTKQYGKEEYYLQYFMCHDDYRDIFATITRCKDANQRYECVLLIMEQIEEILSEKELEGCKYRVRDRQIFEENLEQLDDMKYDLKISVHARRIRNMVSEEQEDIRIDIKSFEELITAIVRVYKELSSKRQLKILRYQNELDSSLNPLVQAYLRLRSCVDISVDTEKEKAKALKYLAVCESIQYLQEYYLTTYMENGRNNDIVGASNDLRKDSESYFHNKLYEKIKEAVRAVYDPGADIEKLRKTAKGRDKVYLATLLQGYVSKAGRTYYEQFQWSDGDEDE